MTIEAMREYISKQYSGRWVDRVKQMPDNQVISVYYRLLSHKEKIMKEAAKSIYQKG